VMSMRRGAAAAGPGTRTWRLQAAGATAAVEGVHAHELHACAVVGSARAAAAGAAAALRSSSCCSSGSGGVGSGERENHHHLAQPLARARVAHPRQAWWPGGRPASCHCLIEIKYAHTKTKLPLWPSRDELYQCQAVGMMIG